MSASFALCKTYPDSCRKATMSFPALFALGRWAPLKVKFIIPGFDCNRNQTTGPQRSSCRQT
eukprot:1140046-Amphidinium_carterae.2